MSPTSSRPVDVPELVDSLGWTPHALKPTIVGRLLRRKAVVLSSLVVIFTALLALFADQIAPFNDHQMGTLINAPAGVLDPTSHLMHWMGTDDLGRDIFSRLLYGTKISMTVGFAADALITAIGVAVGLASGYFGGVVDNLLMRFTDIMYAFPSLVLAVVMVATFGRSFGAILIALGISNWVGIARLVRGQVLQVKELDYVLAAHSLGARPLAIMLRHILPNILGPVIILATLIIPGVMTAEAALAYLNVGMDPSVPTLGGLINSGSVNIFSHPSEIAFPVLTLAGFTLAFTLIGDGLRDALDPHLR